MKTRGVSLRYESITASNLIACLCRPYGVKKVRPYWEPNGAASSHIQAVAGSRKQPRI